MIRGWDDDRPLTDEEKEKLDAQFHSLYGQLLELHELSKDKLSDEEIQRNEEYLERMRQSLEDGEY